MKNTKRAYSFLFAALFMFILGMTNVSHAQPSDESNVTLRLVPEKTVIEGGETILVAIEQDIREGWHTYWINPGDSGAPLKLDWSMPNGFETGDIQWPVPERIAYGPLMNFGYHDKVVLFQPVTAPDPLPDGPVTLSAEYEILVCADICIPEFGTIETTLNTGTSENNQDYIAEHFIKIPIEATWDTTYKVTDGQLHFDIDIRTPAFLSEPGEGLVFSMFPHEWGLIENSADQMIIFTPPQRLEIKTPRGNREIMTDEPMSFVVSYKAGDNDVRGVTLQARADETWLKALKESGQDTNGTESAGNDGTSDQSSASATLASNFGDLGNLEDVTIVQAILFALLGGLILNLMPCVFPILSMKALHFSEAIHKGQGHTKLHGLAYTAGILLSFGLLAGLLIGLQTAGAQIGWGFQLQNPGIILALVFLFFFIGLNLSGFFEVNTSFANIGSGVSQNEGLKGSFFTGVLATIVATPCTAPFMGVAIGFALIQPAIISMAIFLSIGLGLALPFLLLSFIPALGKIFPKPGNWMVTFKEFLAFPIYLSAVWLLWVFVQQTGAFGVLYALGGLTAVTFGIWLLKKGLPKYVAITFIVLAMAATFYSGLMAGTVEDPKAEIVQAIDEIPFTPETLNNILSNEDRPVFVNMTAAWCITCKVNERIALKSSRVKSVIQDRNIAYVVGDWTNYDSGITEYLNSYGRNGVPIYVYYGAKDPDTGERPEAEVLPQLLTPGLVADALSQ